MADSTWLTPASVVEFIEDATPGSAVDRPALAVACNGAAAFVEGRHPGYFDSTGATYTPPADIELGAKMLAARYYARRSSALGSAGFSEFGGDTILRHDPDIARLLRLGTFAPFNFGAPTGTATVTETVIDGGDATP